MISAVAARKAAKAAAESSKPPASPASPPPASRSPSPKSTTASKLVSKRKSRVSSNTSHPTKNKKAKVARLAAVPRQHLRYFATEDVSNKQNETPPGDAEPKTEASSDSSSEDMNIPSPVGLSTKVPKRAWSPSRPIPDSSDDEVVGPSGSFDPANHLTPSTPKKPEPSLLSTFRPTFDQNVFVAQSEHKTSGPARILILQPSETLALVGTYSFQVLQGSLSILGVTLSSSNTKHTVFAPRSSPVPTLSWVASEHPGSCTFPVPPAIQRQQNTTVILVEYVDTGVEGLGRICKVFEHVFSLPRGSNATLGIDLPRIHLVTYGSRSIHPFVLPSSWEIALASIDSRQDSTMNAAPVCLVKGPKKSGKSAYARTLVNRLLSRYCRVAYLECDIGQSEFTPGGLVALNIVENYLFGPPFTHPSLPYRGHYIGSTSPRTSPSYYLHSIQSLLETYKLDLQFPAAIDGLWLGDDRIYDTIPLVVNTMGWTKGLGADLNTRIEEFVDPCHIFELDYGEGPEWRAPIQTQHVPQVPISTPFMTTNIRHYAKVEAIQAETTDMFHTATDHRHLNVLSYFHAVFPELTTPSPSGPEIRQVTAAGWDTSLPLCARYPYEIDYTQAFDHVYLTGAGYEDVVPSELLRALNGAIVGLVSSGPANAFSRPTPLMSHEVPLLSYTPGEPPPDPALSTCYGLALIRGLPLTLDSGSPHMHILTPLPTELLGQSRVLVKGEMELPVWGMLDFREDEEGKVAGIEKGHVPYLQWGRGEGVGTEKRRVRRNLMRKGQM